MKNFLIILVIFSFFLIAGCVIKQPSADLEIEKLNMSLKEKKVLIVVAQNDFQETEYLEPREILENAGVEIKTASFQKGEAKGAQSGKIIQIDFSAEEIIADDFDAIVFIGGGGMVSLVEDEKFINLAKKFNEADKIISAICISPVILANAGLLDGKNATVFSSAKNAIINKGANYTDVDVEVDGKIITANGPAAAKKFGEALVNILSGL